MLIALHNKPHDMYAPFIGYHCNSERKQISYTSFMILQYNKNKYCLITCEILLNLYLYLLI